MKRFLRLFLPVAVLCTAFLHSSFAQDKGYDVNSYFVNLDINRQENYINGAVEMNATAQRPLAEILQHLKSLTIDSVFVNGDRASVIMLDTLFGSYNVVPPSQLSADSQFTVQTFYHGNPTTEAGLNPWGGVQNDGKMMYALGVGFKAPYISCTRHWLPCYDLPDDKAAVVDLSFTVDSSEVVASVGEPSPVISIPNSDKKTYTWHCQRPIATYLMTFAVGPFTIIKSMVKNGFTYTPLHFYCFAEDIEKSNALITKRITQGLLFFDSLFIGYPFEKVGYVVAPIGSMEHQTMITLARAALDTNSTTAVHELAHQWWGDWVTCKDFNDPWLNEGFATYCEALYNERFVGVSQYWKNHKANVAGALATGSAIPLYGTPLTTKPSSNYPTGVLYQKGAAVLGMLRYFIGDSLFFAALREYGNRHAYGNATSYDLEDAFEDVAGQDLDWFFKKWVFGIGYPKLRVNWSLNANNVTVFFEDTSAQNYFRLPLVIEARTKAGDRERHIVWLDSVKFSQGSFTASFVPDTIVIDPDGVVIKKIIGQIRLGVEELRNCRTPLGIRPNPANANITITFTNPLVRKPDTFLIYDSTGDLALSVTTSATRRGEGEYECSTQRLPSGVYTAVAFAGSEILGYVRFTLQH